jgi:hypothetical protein
MKMKEAVFKFSPFSIITSSKKLTLDSDYVSLQDAVWCSLADILYEKSTREFIGLSFSVFSGKEAAAIDLISGADKIFCKYVTKSDASAYEKYNEWGTCDRIELFWKPPVQIYDYIYTSIMMGYWFAEVQHASPDGLNFPCGYYFFDIEATAENYELIAPTE